MMRKARSKPPDERESAALTVRRNMADAVTYLTRVAEDAGMRTVACKLAGVRLALLDPSAGDSDHPNPDEPHAALPRPQPDGAADDRGQRS